MDKTLEPPSCTYTSSTDYKCYHPVIYNDSPIATNLSVRYFVEWQPQSDAAALQGKLSTRYLKLSRQKFGVLDRVLDLGRIFKIDDKQLLRFGQVTKAAWDSGLESKKC